jgi:hypothetical protein
LLFTHHPSIIIHYHPSIIIHYHPSLMGVLMTTGSLWPQMTHYSLLHPIPAPKRTTTQRVVVGWSDGGGEEGAREARAKVETMYRRSKV